MRILTLIAGLSLLTINGCKKKNETFILTGRMVKDCNIPLVNKTFTLRQKANPIGKKSGMMIDFTTDENGFFSVEYIPDNVQPLSIREYKDDLLERIPSRKNLNLGEVYYSPPVTNVILKLNVVNPYTSLDTLTIDYTNLKYAGPFQSGILDTIFNVKLSLPLYYQNPHKVFMQSRVNNNSGNGYEPIKVEVCNDSFHTQVIKIQ